jgi:hypothetical protein
VGNGCKIKVWGDRWLSTPQTYQVQRVIDSQCLVSSLINPISKSWNVDLIQEVFCGDEAQVIANIPLSPLLHEDKLIWRGTASTIFTVCNAYHLGKEVQERVAAQSSHSEARQDMWKALWAMEVPNTVKMFTWRACHNILPTRLSLFKRKIIEDANCPCCGVEEESVIHALWTCLAAKDVWGSKTSPF